MSLRSVLFLTFVCFLSLDLLAARKTTLQGTPPGQLIAAAKQRGRIPVIIGVRDDAWQPEGTLTADDVARQRARGQAKKSELRRLHPGVAPVPDRDFVTVPYFLALVSEAALHRLLDDDRVSSVEEDSALEPVLLQSTVRIGAKRAHSMVPTPYNGAGHIVVVADSGVDPTHPFFGTRILRNDAACFSAAKITGAGDPVGTFGTVCPNGQNTDTGLNAGDPCTVGDYATNPSHTCHHGTKVAGVAAGSNGPNGMTGVAPGAEVISIQIASTCAGDPLCVTFLKSSQIKALDYVVETLLDDYAGKIAAINFSQEHKLAVYSSRPACDTAHPAFKTSVANVRSQEIAVVAATGNSNFHFDTQLRFPSCVSNMIGVSATTDGEIETVPDYANTSSIMDLFAPGGHETAVGERIVTSQNTACGAACGDYLEASGTSLAAPHVTGAFALLRQRNPAATVPQMLADLVRTGTPVNDPDAHGKHRINVDLALTRTRHVRYDHDADGKADVFWRNTANGSNQLYQMNGNAATILPVQGESNLNWKIAGIADFDGDNKADILWRNEVTGQNWMYKMNGNAVTSSVWVNTESNLNWKIAAVGDFNGDNKADIYWRNSATGQNWIYLMNGHVIQSSVSTQSEGDLNWKIVAGGDFNGDGRDDIFWRNSVNGQNWIYLMNGAHVTGLWVQPEGDLNWKVAGAGDFNADGRDDTLWRNEANGTNWIYLMKADNSVTGQTINVEGNLDWKVANVADYDGNGTADIYWRNAATGQNWMYLMNELTITSVPTQNQPDLNWKVQR